jgi:hypothetical protein
MREDYPDDTFTENDVLSCLEGAGLRFKRGSRYILSQCPTHDDENPSVQIYKDDWFVNCHAGCGRFHITKAFPSLRQTAAGGYAPPTNSSVRREEKKVMEHKYIEVDLMEFWQKLPEIPQDHLFKGIPIEELHELGWRYDPNGHRYFIPYFSASMRASRLLSGVTLAKARALISGKMPSLLATALGIWITINYLFVKARAMQRYSIMLLCHGLRCPQLLLVS